MEAMGKMAELPEDMSVIQIGACGQYNNKAFEVIGRQKITWSDGNWNEWFILFSDGKEAWLAESQGQYSISFQVVIKDRLPSLRDVKVNSRFNLFSKVYTVHDIKDVTCQGSQGELPVASPKGRTSVSVDLMAGHDEFANIDYGENEIRVFIGNYVDFENFHFQNLRKLDGWE